MKFKKNIYSKIFIQNSDLKKIVKTKYFKNSDLKLKKKYINKKIIHISDLKKNKKI